MTKNTQLLLGGGVAALLVLVLARRASAKSKAAARAPKGMRPKPKKSLIADVVTVVTGKEPEMEFEPDILPTRADIKRRAKIKFDPSGVPFCFDVVDKKVIPRHNCPHIDRAAQLEGAW